MASIDLTYSGESPGGIYHSVYDDFFWYTHFADTEFVYCKVLAQTAGLMVMRFADADVLPFEFNNFSDTMHKYAGEVKKLLADKQEEVRDRNEAIDGKLYEAVSDPRKPLLPPQREERRPISTSRHWIMRRRGSTRARRITRRHTRFFQREGTPRSRT